MSTNDRRKPKQGATIGGSTYIKPSEIAWKPTRFDGIAIKVLYENKEKGEMTCMLKLDPGASVPFHMHPEIEQAFVIEGSMYDHDGQANSGDYVWRAAGSYHDNHTDVGATILAVYRKPNIFKQRGEVADLEADAGEAGYGV